MAEAAFKRDGGLAGVSTGLTDLDRKLGGLHPSDLIVLAGRPAMGKTALATNIAFHVATAALDDPKLDKEVVAFFRWKCRPSNWPPGFSPNKPRFRRKKSAAASFPTMIFTNWYGPANAWSGRRCTLTTRRPSPSPNCARGCAA